MRFLLSFIFIVLHGMQWYHFGTVLNSIVSETSCRSENSRPLKVRSPDDLSRIIQDEQEALS